MLTHSPCSPQAGDLAAALELGWWGDEVGYGLVESGLGGKLLHVVLERRARDGRIDLGLDLSNDTGVRDRDRVALRDRLTALARDRLTALHYSTVFPRCCLASGVTTVAAIAGGGAAAAEGRLRPGDVIRQVGARSVVGIYSGLRLPFVVAAARATR